MAIEPQNLIQVQSHLQDPTVTNEDLIKYANNSNPEVPSFLALIEMNRRKQIESTANKFNQSNAASVKDQVTSALMNPTTTPNLTANPFDKGLTSMMPGVNMSGNPFTKNPALATPQINPGAAPVMPETGPTKMAAEGGLMSLPVGHFNSNSYAGGGIVAFGDPNLNPNENQVVNAAKTVGGMTVDQAVEKAKQNNAITKTPFTAEDESVIRRRFAGAEADPTVAKTNTGATQGKTNTAPSSNISPFQGILASLPPSPKPPEEKTAEQLFQDKKERDRLAGVSADPYSEVKAAEKAREERQAENYKQFGMDRLLAQLTAFGNADPARGFGYAAGVSAEASAKLGKEQNELRDKEENAIIEFKRGIAKEEDARRRNDSDGIKSALDAQQKAKLDFQKVEHDRGILAAHIYQTEEYAKSRRDAAAQAAANKPDPDDVLYNRILAKAAQDPAYRAQAKKLDMLTVGTQDYDDAMKELYRLTKPYFAKRPDLMPPEPGPSTSSTPQKSSGWEPPPWLRSIIGGPAQNNTMPENVQKALDKYK